MWNVLNTLSPTPAWYCAIRGSVHRAARSVGLSMRRTFSSSGIEAPALVSVLNPSAPPCARWSYQYDGGIQSYGPVIFTPVGPSTDDVSPDADARMGFGQRASRRAVTYIRCTSNTGLVSLPIRNVNTLGWLRNRIACEVMEARATPFS